jgi:hypothetical protein
VCNFSGVVVHGKKFVETEFLDTMVVFGSEQMQVQNSMFEEVEQIVTAILSSSLHTRMRENALLSTLLKLNNKLQAAIEKCDVNLMLVCTEFISSCMKTPYIFPVSDDKRRRYAKEATEQCCKVLQILIQNGMHVRGFEIQRLAVGVLYLMRSGVVFQDVHVLQQRTDIYNLLPPETNLNGSFGVHPKCITDIENRLKFCLRNSMK